MSSPFQSATFILVRHGETDWNAAGRFQGHTDIPLNENGVIQALTTAKKLILDHPDITAIYSSDLLRAKGTALHCAEHFKLPVETRASLREFRGGAAEGMTRQELDAKYLEKWEALALEYPDKEQRWNHTPVLGQETINEQIVRIKKELTEIAVSHPNGKVAIFTHGGILKSFVTYMSDLDHGRNFTLPNCSIIEVFLEIKGLESFFRLVKIEKSI